MQTTIKCNKNYQKSSWQRILQSINRQINNIQANKAHKIDIKFNEQWVIRINVRNILHPAVAIDKLLVVYKNCLYFDELLLFKT